MVTPSAIQAAASALGHSITILEAAGLVFCVAGKMLLGKDLMDAVRDYIN